MRKRVILTRPATNPSVVVRKVSSAQQNTNPPCSPPPSPPIGGGVRGVKFAAAGKQEEVSKVEQATSLFATMTDEERKQTLDLLALRCAISGRAADDRDLAMWSEAVYSALVASATPEDGAAHGPLLVKRLLAASHSWSPVDEFMRRSKLSELTVSERQAAYQLLARLLVEHAKQVADYVGAPLTPKFLSNQTPALAGVFEKSFPGYVAAGLARIIARRSVTSVHR